MTTYVISFFGHRDIFNASKIEVLVEQVLENALKKYEIVEIQIGRNGDFDIIVASVAKRFKKRTADFRLYLTLVLPYVTKEFEDNEVSLMNYYDGVEIIDSFSKIHYKKAYEIRNRKMVDRSDLVCFFVNRETGGAYQTMKYALKINKEIINLAENSDVF